MTPDFEHPRELPCPDGPLLLRGNHLVPDANGTLHPTTRPVSAVCQCSKSAIQPWCDGTHKLATAARKRAAETMETGERRPTGD